MSDNHCRHCSEDCMHGGRSPIMGMHHDAGADTLWRVCPACAERDTIADMCDEEALTAQPERLPAHDAVAQTWGRAADMIRGEA